MWFVNEVQDPRAGFRQDHDAQECIFQDDGAQLVEMPVCIHPGFLQYSSSRKQGLVATRAGRDLRNTSFVKADRGPEVALTLEPRLRILPESIIDISRTRVYCQGERPSVGRGLEFTSWLKSSRREETSRR